MKASDLWSTQISVSLRFLMNSLFEFLHSLHSADGIAQMISSGGWIVIALIVFAETGLLLGFFLPGDSLLITAGLLSNPANPHVVFGLDIVWLNCILILAVCAGDQVGFLLGHKTGDRIWQRPDSRMYKRRHLEDAHAFYERFGGLSIVGARFVPIARTFVPFVAGVARMPYRRYVFWSIGAGILWITSLLWVGYYLGQTKLASSIDKIIVLVIFVSVLPMAVGVFKRWMKSRTG